VGRVEAVAMPRNTGRSFVLRKGERIRIYAESIVDLVAFNLDNLRERFDQARTKANQAKIFLTTGDVLYSKFNNVMMTITHDTFRGKHDLQYGFCSFTRIASAGVHARPSYEVFWERAKREPFFTAMMQTAGIGKRETCRTTGVGRTSSMPSRGTTSRPRISRARSTCSRASTSARMGQSSGEPTAIARRPASRPSSSYARR